MTLTHTHTCTHTLFRAACSQTIRLVSGFMVVLHPVKKRTRSHKTREKHEHLYCWQVYRDAAAASCRDQTGCWSCVSHAQILPLLTKHNISTQWNNSTEERVFLWCLWCDVFLSVMCNNLSCQTHIETNLLQETIDKHTTLSFVRWRQTCEYYIYILGHLSEDFVQSDLQHLHPYLKL